MFEKDQMRIIHFCAGLGGDNGMANTARQFVEEETAAGHDSRLTNDPADIAKGVDVVHIHGAWLPVLWKVAKKAKAVGAKLIVRPAGSYDPMRLAYHGWKKTLVAPFEHAMLRRADVLLATCEAEAVWIRAYEARVKKIEITDLKRFFNLENVGEQPKAPPRGTLTGYRVSLRSDFRSVRVLYLGRRHPLKGVEFLERAVAELNQSSEQFELRIVSDHFGEELEKDWDWCDVLCLPTLSENFGRVVAEALERGKRVVTTDGAPAWATEERNKEEGIRNKCGRLIYLRGYRDGTDEERVELLKRGLSQR